MTSADTQLWNDAFYRAVDPLVQKMGLMPATPGQVFRPVHQLIEDFDLWYTVRGRGRVLIDEQWVDFAGGDLLLIRPGEHYREDQADATDPFEQYYVHVLPLGGRHDKLDRALAAAWPRRLSFAHQPALEGLFAELFEVWTARADGYDLRLKALMLSIFQIIFTRLRHETCETLPPAWPKLMRARDFIVRHHCRDLTLDEIAEAADLSSSYLLTLFRRHLGRSPIQYQTELRLRHARNLLARGTSVGEVADRAGFHSLHYFSRTFHRHVGLSPTAFAQRSRRK
ncbi:MAG: AraC family transcriptional regulator [Planctomycetes bacterium]|nr:AraC family transcriptional regulator [Planctomycetota bacterium]